jgi:PAS domain S-box-containing protein
MAVMAPLGASETGAPDFRRIADSMPHLVWMAGPDGRVDYFNRQCAQYAGFDVEPMGKWEGVALIHPDDVEPTWLAWRYSTRTMSAYDVECRVRRFDGEYRWHALRARPIRAPGGSVSGWIGTATDINDAKVAAFDLRLAQRHVAETSTLIEMLQSEAPVGLAAVDRELRLVRVDDTFAQVVGSTVTDLLGCTLGSVIALTWPQIEPL